MLQSPGAATPWCGVHRRRCRAAQLHKPADQRKPNMKLYLLSLKRVCHHTLAQTLEAAHLGFQQTPAVVTAAFFSDAPAQRPTSSVCLVAGDLPQQFELHGRIPNAVACHLNGPKLQHLSIHAQMHFASLSAVHGSVFLAIPLALNQKLDAGTVHKQVQGLAAALVGQLPLQMLLPLANCAQVRHLPSRIGQLQQAGSQPQALTQGQPEQAFDVQTKLDGCVREDALAPPFATGGCVPLHGFVQPDGQRSSGFKRCAVRRPVGRLVARLRALGFGHVPSLSARLGCFVQQSPFHQALGER